jgi:hypothetical protein
MKLGVGPSSPPHAPVAGPGASQGQGAAPPRAPAPGPGGGPSPSSRPRALSTSAPASGSSPMRGSGPWRAAAALCKVVSDAAAGPVPRGYAFPGSPGSGAVLVPYVDNWEGVPHYASASSGASAAGAGAGPGAGGAGAGAGRPRLGGAARDGPASPRPRTTASKRKQDFQDLDHYFNVERLQQVRVCVCVCVEVDADAAGCGGRWQDRSLGW